MDKNKPLSAKEEWGRFLFFFTHNSVYGMALL
jgi:hypothetical protein